MSLLTYNQPNQLSDDVLLVIFDQLDEDDLLRCEVVCRQWRNVLQSGRVWKRLFRRQIVSSEQWRRVLQNFEVDVDELETVHYRSLCRTIIRHLKAINRNWRTGNFKEREKIVHNGRQVVAVENDCVVTIRTMEHNFKQKLFFFDRRNTSENYITIPPQWSVVTNTKIVVTWDRKTIKIMETNGQVISKLRELKKNERISWNLESCCITGDQMAVLSRTDGQEKLSLWDLSDRLRITRLKSQHFNLCMPFGYGSSIKMDDQFIFISSIRNESTSFYFFSKEALELHWQKKVDGNMKENFAYGKSLLLLYMTKKNEKAEEYGIIQIYDVKSKKCFHEMRIPVKYDFETFEDKVGFNSKFMVVAYHRRDYGLLRKMNIYDLEAIKNPKSNEDDLLVHTLAVNLNFNRIELTETEYIHLFYERVHSTISHSALDFSLLENHQNPAKSVTLSSPWRSVWRSKGVDEEPLEPVRHMEVYEEVLKFFDELSKNCQAAIETYPVVDPDVASFNFGDDFIGYRQHSPRMVIYGKKMKKRSCYMKCKTVQISKTTHVSVMGQTIQLIDVATGNVFQETKIEEDAIGLHFGGNRLVCVFRTAQLEYLLRVWKVENSLILTHLKDVTIEDYNDEDPLGLQVDEHFIAVHTPIGDEDTTCNLISLKTFEIERSLSCDYCFKFFYDGGYLFLVNGFVVRILDVASGTFLHNMPVEPPFYSDSGITRVNSNYVVVAPMNSNPKSINSKLYVYDLKCVKDIDADPTHLLLTTIDLECKVEAMMMNETKIVCLSDKNMRVVDLKPIDRLRCPELC